MTKSIHKSVQEIMNQSMSNAFGGQKEEVVEELTDSEKRKLHIANAIEEAKLAREKEAELEEVVKYKSEKATTSDEKEEEIVEKKVKNKIEINPSIKESIVGKIYTMYNNKYLSEKKAKKDYDGDGKVEAGA